MKTVKKNNDPIDVLKYQWAHLTCAKDSIIKDEEPSRQYKCMVQVQTRVFHAFGL